MGKTVSTVFQFSKDNWNELAAYYSEHAKFDKRNYAHAYNCRCNAAHHGYRGDGNAKLEPIISSIDDIDLGWLPFSSNNYL